MIAVTIPAAGFVLSASAGTALHIANHPLAAGFGFAALVWAFDLALVVSQ